MAIIFTIEVPIILIKRTNYFVTITSKSKYTLIEKYSLTFSRQY